MGWRKEIAVVKKQAQSVRRIVRVEVGGFLALGLEPLLEAGEAAYVPAGT